MIKCFFITPTNNVKRWLRCYSRGDQKCPLHGYHNAQTFLDIAPAVITPEGYEASMCEGFPKDEFDFPSRCDCGYQFEKGDRQLFTDRVYQRTDTEETMGFREFQRIPGAMWDAWWMPKHWHGPDGKALCVVLPDGHHWNIDSRASNCDSPCVRCAKPYHNCKCKHPEGYVDARPHQCWVRHGEPPNLTVDKNGITCNAGAGSILTDKWHGFLRNGCLVT